MEKEILKIFMHIPKTAGISMNYTILDQYNRDEIAILHEDADWSTVRLAELCNEQNSRIKIISGHFPFGIHEWINRPCVYFTFLRHPIELVISVYSHILRNPEIYSYPNVSKMSFDEFVESDTMNYLTSNIQTKFLAGSPSGYRLWSGDIWNTESHFSTPGNYSDALVRAKQNLHRYFIFTGITDRFEDCLIPMCKALGWKNPNQVHHQNKAESWMKISYLDPRTLQILTDKNKSDFQLYEYVLGLLKLPNNPNG